MAIPKITGTPFTDIRSWLWERDKIITPNPLRPLEKELVKGGENANNFNKLQRTLIGFYDKINVIVDEVNDLGRRVSKNENDITVINNKLTAIDTQLKLKSVVGHMHPPNAGGPVGPSLTRKGGSIRKMKQGGSSGQCIKHRMSDGTVMDGPTHGPGQTCIEWSNGNYQNGGRFTRPVITNKEQMKQKLIAEIKRMQ